MPSPVVTATFQSTFLSALSNVLAQTLSSLQANKPLSLNTTTVLHFLLFALISTPPNFYWQEYLEALWPAYVPVAPTSKEAKEKPGAARQTLSIPNTFKKFFVDQLVGGPVNTVLYLMVMGSLQGMNANQLAQYVQADFWPLTTAGLKVWPLAAMVGFCFVPAARRVTFASLVNMGWCVYLGLAMEAS